MVSQQKPCMELSSMEPNKTQHNDFPSFTVSTKFHNQPQFHFYCTDSNKIIEREKRAEKTNSCTTYSLSPSLEIHLICDGFKQLIRKFTFKDENKSFRDVFVSLNRYRDSLVHKVFLYSIFQIQCEH